MPYSSFPLSPPMDGHQAYPCIRYTLRYLFLTFPITNSVVTTCRSVKVRVTASAWPYRNPPLSLCRLSPLQARSSYPYAPTQRYFLIAISNIPDGEIHAFLTEKLLRLGAEHSARLSHEQDDVCFAHSSSLLPRTVIYTLAGMYRT